MPEKALPRILYVDSDDQACTDFQRLFAGARNYLEVVCEKEITKVIDLVDSETVDLYVLEYCLPSITGSQLCERIRKSDKATPIVIYSVLFRDVDREHAMQSGANAYLVKPDEVYKLPSTINRLLFPMPLMPRHYNHGRRSSGII